MKIIIDCRYYNQSGIGSYLNLIINSFSNTNHNVLLLGDFNEIRHLKKPIIHNNSSPLSLKGLFIKGLKADIFITPYFYIPFRINAKIYSVVHDLAFIEIQSCNKSRFDKFIKTIFLKRALKISTKVFSVSKFSIKKIKECFDYDKTILTYLDVDELIKNYDSSKVEKEDYIIFVGNFKEHKGIRLLMEANRLLLEDNIVINIKIIGSKDKLKVKSDVDINYDNIEFLGNVSSDELITYISKAQLLVLPSYYEGFGLPPLEALYLNTLPIISDIEVFKEIYSNSDAVFFKSGDANDLKRAINENFFKSYDIKRVVKFEKFKDVLLGVVNNEDII